MADQDNEQIQDQQPNQPSQEPAVDEDALYKDIGQHVAKKYQEFLDSRSQGDIAKAKEEYKQSQSPQSGLAALADLGGNLPQQPAPVPQTTPIQQPAVQQTAPQPLKSDESSLEQQAKTAGSELNEKIPEVYVNIEDTLSKGVQQQQQLLQNAQQRYANNMKQDMALSQEYQSGRIQPMQIFSGNTGQKLLTGLGLLFSGLGSGITGQSNMAMQMINQTIQRDMEAQKLNSEKEYNTWRMHREMTGDQMSADMAFQREAMIALNSQIEQQKMKLASPQAQLAAVQTQAQLNNQLIDLGMKQASYDAMKGLSQQTPSPGIINNQRWQQLKMAGVLKGEDETNATKEAQKLEEIESVKQDYMNGFNQLNKKFLAGALTPADRDSFIWDIAGKIQHIGAGRFNMEDAIKQAKSMYPGMLEFESTRKDKLANGLKFFENESKTPTLDRLGLKNQSQALQQSETKTMNGRQYTKVPGGWQLVR